MRANERRSAGKAQIYPPLWLSVKELDDCGTKELELRTLLCLLLVGVAGSLPLLRPPFFVFGIGTPLP